MANRRTGWHSGHLKTRQLTVEDSLTVNGNLVFGDATTDTLEVNGAANFDLTVDIDGATTSTNAVLDISQTGTGRVVFVNQDSTGNPDNALFIDDEATGATNSALKINSARTGRIVEIFAEGASSNVMEIDVADGGTGTALYVDHNETDGAAVGIHVDVASTSASAFVMKVTGIATNSGVFQTNGIGTTADSVAAVFVVQGGSTTYYLPLMSTFA